MGEEKLMGRTRAFLGLFVLLLALAVRAQEGPSPESAPPAEPPAPAVAEGVPVQFDGKTLFHLYDNGGVFTPQERAAAAEERLLQIANDPFYNPGLLTLQPEDSLVRIFYRGKLVGVVTDQEAGREGKTSAIRAEELVHIFRAAVAEYHARRQPEEVLRGWTLLGLSSAILVALLLVLRWAYRRAARRGEAKLLDGEYFWIQHRLSLKPEKAAALQLKFLKFARALATLFLLLAYVQISSIFMPMTRGYAYAVLDYLLEPLATLYAGFIAHVGDFFFIGVVVVLVFYVLRLLRWVMVEAAEGSLSLPGVSPVWAMALYKAIRLVLLATAAVVIYPYIPGSSSEAFKGLGLFAGALFTLGASGAAGNFIGGVVLIFTGAFQLGDRVKIGDTVGEVVETNFSVTRLRTPKNEVVTIPNAKVMGGDIVNYSEMARREGLILHTSVTIGYDAPWVRVHELLLEAARRTPGVASEPAPFVLQKALNDFYVEYEINAYTRDATCLPATYGRLHQNIQDAFNEGGVEIMSPHFTSLRDGGAVTIPEGQRPEGYRPPAFAVRLEEREK